MLPIKSLHFEAGSTCLEPGEKYRVLYDKVPSSNGHISNNFDDIHLKFQHMPILSVLSLHVVKYKNSKSGL